MHNYDNSQGVLGKKLLRIEDIRAGREGWVYLIHAVGTNRYKIGRSTKPVVRHQVLQNQSPYPLKIVDSFWTVDAVTDEGYLHKAASEYRTHGEWFELEHGGINSSYFKVETEFFLGFVMNGLARSGLHHFFDQMKWDKEESGRCLTLFSALVLKLYSEVTDRASLISSDQFMREHLFQLVSNFMHEVTINELNTFIIGALVGFASGQGRILR